MILAPPLFPFPLLFIANLTLKHLLPNDVPEKGFSEMCWRKAEKSEGSEGYFFESLFISLLNSFV